MATLACQICLDIIEDGPDNSLLTKICDESCSARVCRECLGQHVDVTLKQFYPGILPRVRCPICLIQINQSRWEHRVPSYVSFALTATYDKLCHQACAVTPPCGHKAGYTHLPLFDVSREVEDQIELLPSQVEKYRALCVEFCRHKEEPRAVLDYAFDTFGEEKAMTLVNELTLPTIIDPERRATLLLSLMYFRPNTKTNCCGVAFCFNCKRSGHHETCPEEFNEDNDLVRCRKCHALLLKVQGCDAVNCVCGFFMNWRIEQRLRQNQKRNLLPIDIFDTKLTNAWLDFRRRQVPLLDKLWLQKWVITCRPLLRHHFAVYVWRRRFTKFLVTAQLELYWKAYHRWHPEELKATAEEANELFNITA